MPDDTSEVPPELLHAMRGGAQSVDNRGGCVIRCEVDPHTGAALIAFRDKFLRDVLPDLGEDARPADPFAFAVAVLSEWAQNAWRNGYVGPEHHEEALKIAQARWREVAARADQSPES